MSSGDLKSSMKFPSLIRIKILAKKCGQLLDHRFAPMGLTDTKTRILSALAHRSPQTATDLLPWTEVEKASLTALLQSLEREGLIERAPHPTDRRAVLLTITEAGREAQRAAIDALVKADRDLLSVFSEEEAAEFNQLCDRLFARLGELSGDCSGKRGPLHHGGTVNP
jgi:DNA-binding MarR family transcriptional regulator